MPSSAFNLDPYLSQLQRSFPWIYYWGVHNLSSHIQGYKFQKVRKAKMLIHGNPYLDLAWIRFKEQEIDLSFFKFFS